MRMSESEGICRRVCVSACVCARMHARRFPRVRVGAYAWPSALWDCAITIERIVRARHKLVSRAALACRKRCAPNSWRRWQSSAFRLRQRGQAASTALLLCLLFTIGSCHVNRAMHSVGTFLGEWGSSWFAIALRARVVGRACKFACVLARLLSC